MYEGAFKHGNLLLSPPPGPMFNHIAKKEVRAADLADNVGSIVSSFPVNSSKTPYVHIGLKGEQQTSFVAGLPLDDIRAYAQGLVEIEVIGALVPFEFLEDSFNGTNPDKLRNFLHEVFSDAAEGKANANSYKAVGFINPVAVESIEDNGSYRTLHLKAEYGGDGVVKTALPLFDLKKRLANLK